MLLKRFLSRCFQKILYLARLFMKFKEPIIIDRQEELINILINNKYQNILLLSGERVKKTLFYQEINDCLTKQFNVFNYAKIPTDPSITSIEDAVGYSLENQIDVIIAVGGGSTMDAGKVLAARLKNLNQSITKMKGLLKVKKKPLPLIVMPTTAGTGSECTVAAVVSDLENKKKYAINDPKLIPSYAILNPNVLKTLPNHLTAYCGMDTLSHLLEAYLGSSNTKKSKMNAILGCKLVFEALPKIYQNKELAEEILKMQKASYLGGLVINQGYVGYVHAIAHAFAAYYHMQHGYLNAIIMPYVLEAYKDKINKKAKILLKEVFGLDVEIKLAGQNLTQKIKELNQSLNIENTMQELIKETDYQDLINHINQEVIPLYPVPKFLSNEELINIFNKIKNNA